MSQYLNPTTIEEACSLALKHKEQAKIMAGGTDLLVRMKRQKVLPSYIINIKGIGKDDITFDNRDGLRIGALATIHSIETSVLIREKFALLAHAAGQLGSAQVRERATIAGNLCNASPSAETAPPLIVLGAKANIMGIDGNRIIPIENFFIGPGQTELRAGEIVADILIPNIPLHSGAIYIKHTVRKAMDLAMVGVAVMVTMEGDVLSDIKIALGAVAPTPMRAKRAEEVLKGKKLTDDLLQNAGKAASNESRPIDDIRSSADYRRKMIEILVTRAIKQAMEEVKT